MEPHPAEGTDRTRPLSLYDSVFSNDHTPLLPGCKCFACQHHTRSYLHHLLLTHEMLAQVLLMMHNMHHYWVFFESIRASITDSTFEQAAADFHGC
ncbi:hypothetical protein SARC_11563 [Sphaeroforma arctica JP610]|uniref:tRNA-guanine(15) transglycosylase-like domain-containing protein n=1 Tax=Sphaeroforma arctica JP610 TaxID=667725 RepID=A0A0L0FIQ8_9EUKA|nr:hypothetical protein SARC_11563 [Sphaeroforma arctica JP610]KNC75923.1 hypothetical protein SARC_11563 [Sphaeroforma arctica JP610]|eukprot:XP_014149825.1 hypothetical protein SARC_11563 [Sphaeroforma arctica JP610]